jgi:nucleoside-diphosphate-sugar epimerase
MAKKKILILGGTRYIGKSLVKTFLIKEKNLNLYILSRRRVATTTTTTTTKIKYINANLKSFENKIPKLEFDSIFDFISSDVKVLDKIIRKIKFRNYYFISTSWVTKGNKKNKINKKISLNFIPQVKLSKKTSNYIKRKIKLENFLINKFIKLKKKIVIFRLPIVIGGNDYTKRLKKIQKKIKLCSNLNLLDSEKKINLIWIKDLVKSIYLFTKLKKLKKIQIIECLNLKNISFREIAINLYKKKFKIKYKPSNQKMKLFSQDEFINEIRLQATKNNIFLKTNVKLKNINKIILNEKI